MSRPATAIGATHATGATTATNATDTTRAIGFAVSENNSRDERKGASAETGLARADDPAPASALHGYFAEDRVSLARTLCRLHGEFGRATVWALTLALARHATLPTATVSLTYDVLDMLTFDDLPTDHDPTVFAARGQPAPHVFAVVCRLRHDLRSALAAARAHHGTESY